MWHLCAYVLVLATALSISQPAHCLDDLVAVEADKYERLAREHMQAQNYQAAESCLGAAIAIDPTSDRYLKRGSLRYSQHDFAGATDDFTTSIELGPKCHLAYHNRGVIAFCFREDSETALSDLTKAIILDASEPKTYAYRALAWQSKGWTRFAISDWSEAIKLDDSNIDYRIRRLKCRKRLEQWEEVVEECTDLIELEPSRARHFITRAEGRRRAGQDTQAKEDLENAIVLEPENPDGFAFLAYLLVVCTDEDLRDGVRAVDLATKACELSGWKDSGYLGCLAYVYYTAGDTDKAIEIQSSAVNLEEDSRRGRAARILAKYRSKASIDYLDRM